MEHSKRLFDGALSGSAVSIVNPSKDNFVQPSTLMNNAVQHGFVCAVANAMTPRSSLKKKAMYGAAIGAATNGALTVFGYKSNSGVIMNPTLTSVVSGAFHGAAGTAGAKLVKKGRSYIPIQALQ